MTDYKRGGTATLILLALLITLAYLVPYGPLRGVESWFGVFLFWTAFGVAAIALIFRLVAGWRP
jgi:uncharacterized membrane protein